MRHAPLDGRLLYISIASHKHKTCIKYDGLLLKSGSLNLKHALAEIQISTWAIKLVKKN
jgi:hypothetical protein